MKKLFTVVAACLLSFSSMAVDRTQIAESQDQVTPILNGQPMPDSKLLTADGKKVSLKEIADGKPSLVIFYRGGWCPYCSQQLASLRNVEKDFLKKGVKLIAISPDSPARLSKTKTETKTPVVLLADPELNAIRDFGLGYFLADNVAKRYRGMMGSEFTATGGEERIVLPVPAAYLVDADGKVIFNYVNPDFRIRVSEELLLAAADLLP